MRSNVLFVTLCLQLILRPAGSQISNKKFPDNFLFGTATASYQIEGGWNADGKGENIWDHLVHTKPYYILNFDNGDVACDSYHKYLEDVAMLKNLGVNHYRFSISWSRILPTGFVNKVNQAGVDYYKNLIAALKENGIEPYVTLYHWDLPQPLQDIGGWPNPLLADYFADYARLMFTLFGDDVKNWMTFNEPRNTCNSGYGYGYFPPGYISPGVDTYLCAHTIIKSHARAYHIYNEEFKEKQNGRIAIVIDTSWYEPESDSEQDVEAAERIQQFGFGWFANPIFKGNYPQVMIDRIAERSQKEGFQKSRLPEFTTDEIGYIKGTYDFLALNSYTTSMVRWVADSLPIGFPSYDADISVEQYQNATWDSAASVWLKVVPWGMRKLLNWLDKTYDHPEIFITENGYSDYGGLEDDERIDYYSQYLSNILEAIHEDGINVTGYTAWSLMDNFEWNSGYHDKFGLYHVDFDSPNRTRTIKKSGDYYKNVIASRCLVEKCEE